MGLSAFCLWPHQLNVTEEDRGVFAVLWISVAGSWHVAFRFSCLTGATTSTSLYFTSGALTNHHCDQIACCCVQGGLIKAGMGMKIFLFDILH